LVKKKEKKEHAAELTSGKQFEKLLCVDRKQMNKINGPTIIKLGKCNKSKPMGSSTSKIMGPTNPNIKSFLIIQSKYMIIFFYYSYKILE
jgi:hypothetical protein